jgi:hypothetical protein
MAATKIRLVPGVAVERCIAIDGGTTWQRCQNRSVTVWTIDAFPIAGTCRVHSTATRLVQTLTRLGAAAHPWDGAEAVVDR